MLFKFTGKLNKITLMIDRPKLTPGEGEKKSMAAQRNNKPRRTSAVD